jgi:predicted nucleic acid-binding protein
MSASRCTIDSSCVIALDQLDLLPQLSLLFSIVLVPKAVRDELFKRRATKDRLHSLFEAYAFLQRCDGYEKGTVEFLLAERTREGAQDRGEVEAIVQASEFGATDPWGRELAALDDLEFHGTLWVLQRFHELDLLSSTALRDSLASLQRRGTRLPWNTVNEFLAQIGQQPL